jgi:hypothetical protein
MERTSGLQTGSICARYSARLLSRGYEMCSPANRNGRHQDSLPAALQAPSEARSAYGQADRGIRAGQKGTGERSRPV